MSILAVGFGIVERHVSGPVRRSVLQGLLFGLGAILVMMEPVNWFDGVIIDARAIIVGLAAAFAGWPAAILAAVAAAAYRLYLGGIGAYAGIAGIGAAAILGHLWSRRVASDRRTGTRALVGLGATISVYSICAVFLPPSMHWQVVTTVIPPLIVACILGALAMGHLIERERRHMRTEAHWKADAHTDTLTQLPNRRWFRMAVSSDLAIPTGPIDHALLVIDADHFKAINDRHGHAAGDAALVFIADMVRMTTRETDRICRLGGEEFAIFLSNGSRQAISRIAEGLRHRICEAPFIFDGAAIPITVSIGAVIEPKVHRSSVDALLQTADAALYAAKAEGRNRVAFADDSNPKEHLIARDGEAGHGPRLI